MNINIKMLDVRDGDAIILHLDDNQRQLVILVDGGHAGDAINTIKQLEPFLTRTKKKSPDLIICTHYDDDHIGGLRKIIGHYKSEPVGMVWIHQPGILFNAMNEAQLFVKDRENNPTSTKTKELMFEMAKKNIHGGFKFVIESYPHLVNLIGFLDERGINHKEPFLGDSLKDWPELEVIGPSKPFYNSLFPYGIKPEGFLMELAEEESGRKMILEAKKYKLDNDPCKFLDETKKDKVTKTNLASVIFTINVNGKKFLFTGDAGIPSFESIPKEKLENIFWLKVAHHGSHNNSSSELMKLMSPKYAFISGANYIDEEVIQCLKKNNVIVRTTRDEKTDLTWPIA